MKLPDKTLKILLLLARWVLGFCFVFSGFVKAVDPWGTAYKLDDYFNAFGWSLLTDLSFVFSLALSAFEFYLGGALLLGLNRRLTALNVLLFLLFLTPFTLYVLIAHPVTDCGCFGDALVLSNGATFAKNLVLLALSLLVYLHWDTITPLYGPRTARWAAAWVICFPLLISARGSLHAPVLDFRPYKVGNHLPDLMGVPGGAASDSVVSVFIYEKNGKQESFSLEKAPIGDSSWTFVDRKDEVIRKGIQPLIHDFTLTLPDQGDITQEVLSDTSYVFLFVADKLEDMDYKGLTDVLEAKKYALHHGYRFLGLTSSTPKMVEDWRYENDEAMSFCPVDDRVLKSMIRSNPGLILLRNGTVYQKWTARDIPDFSAVDTDLRHSDYGLPQVQHTVKMLVQLCLMLVLPLLFFWLWHHGSLLQRRKRRPSETTND
jgi:uncharacterized membrane protein YphA (DoxX/SURF4 family)